MLQTKRQMFATEYLVDHNATKAAERAGYSVRTAKQQGSRLLTYVDVQSEIAALEVAQLEADHVDRSFVIAGLRDLALNASSYWANISECSLSRLRPPLHTTLRP